MKDNFKYFVKIAKAYEENGQWYVEGIASGTKEDRDEQRMSKNIIDKFVEAINKTPLPLTNSHPRTGDIMGDLGEVIYAEALPDEYNSLFIKGRLDKDHPANQLMLKKITQLQKKYAFSIEGLAPKVRTVWSENLKKFIDEFYDVIPKSISITTEPSYIPSFMEVLSKAANKSLTQAPEIDQNNLTINKNIMDKTTEETTTTTETVETTTEATTEVDKEATTAVEETTTESETVGETIDNTEVVGLIKSVLSELAEIKKSFGTEQETLKKAVLNQNDALVILAKQFEQISTTALPKKSVALTKTVQTEATKEATTVRDLLANSIQQ